MGRRVYFKLYFSSRRILLEMLDDAQRGRVIAAAFDYAEFGTEPPESFSTEERFAFESIRVWIDDGISQYDRRSETSCENGKLGGRPRKNSAEKPKNLKKPNNLTAHKDKDMDKDMDMDMDIAAVAASEQPQQPNTPESFFSENFGELTSYYQHRIENYRKRGCTDDLILRAMQEALDYGVANWSYVRNVLERCVEEGLKDVKSYEQSRRPKSSGHNIRVDRAQPSRNDWITAAIDRPRQLKRKEGRP